jgi:Lon protease-like protein
MTQLSYSLPSEAPVMVLPGTHLFPLALLPLTIFEPRYRQMLAHTLENERMFCIALMKPGVQTAITPDDFFSVAGIGLIRACVGNEDGTSNLILQGIHRVQFTGWAQINPFRVAKITPLLSSEGDPEECDLLAAKLINLCEKLRTAETQFAQSIKGRLADVNNPELLGDIVAHTLVRDPLARQDLLQEISIPTRLRKLIKLIKQEVAEQ